MNVFDWPDMNLRCKICITKLFSKMKNSFPNQLWHAISWIGVGSTYNTKTTQSQTKEYWHPIQVEWPAILLYQLTSFTKLLFKSVGNQIRNLWFRKCHQGFGMYHSPAQFSRIIDIWMWYIRMWIVQSKSAHFCEYPRRIDSGKKREKKR